VRLLVGLLEKGTDKDMHAVRPCAVDFVRGAKINGGDGGIRTPDPHVANVMLSQLSYIPTAVPLVPTSRGPVFCKI
jgi:hypothetical protein